MTDWWDEQRKKRGLLYRLGDGLIGFDDGVETAGEALGKGINQTAKRIGSDPVGLLGELAGSTKRDLDNLMFEGGAMERPEAVLGYAAAPMAPGIAGGRYAANVMSAGGAKPDVNALLGEARQRLADRAAMADRLAADGQPVRMEAGGRKALISPSSDKPGQWRITTFGDDGQPSGHIDAADKRAAVARALEDGYSPPKQGIKAYHGSPHDFDKFSMDKIGTGEGAQAYGHGLYFAENENVAASYRDALQAVDVEPLRRIGLTDAQLAEARWRVADTHPAAIDTGARDFAHYIGLKDTPELRAAFAEAKKPGSMYEVNINADPDDFLDWDAGFRQLPENHQKALERLINETDKPSTPKQRRADDDLLAELGVPDDYADSYDPFANITGAGAYNTLADPMRRGQIGIVAEHRAASRAAEDLKSAGIPGIKYRDAGSRGADNDGTRNFVVFDENLIEIVRKYGIAGAAAMLGVSAAEVEAAVQ